MQSTSTKGRKAKRSTICVHVYCVYMFHPLSVEIRCAFFSFSFGLHMAVFIAHHESLGSLNMFEIVRIYNNRARECSKETIPNYITLFVVVSFSFFFFFIFYLGSLFCFFVEMLTMAMGSIFSLRFTR